MVEAATAQQEIEAQTRAMESSTRQSPTMDVGAGSIHHISTNDHDDPLESMFSLCDAYSFYSESTPKRSAANTTGASSDSNDVMAGDLHTSEPNSSSVAKKSESSISGQSAVESDVVSEDSEVYNQGEKDAAEIGQQAVTVDEDVNDNDRSIVLEGDASDCKSIQPSKKSPVYNGVYPSSCAKASFEARILHNKQEYYLGSADLNADAGLCYDIAAKFLMDASYEFNFENKTAWMKARNQELKQMKTGADNVESSEAAYERLERVVKTVVGREPVSATSRTSRYHGVSYNKQSNMFITKISVNSNALYLGSYRNEIDAAVAFDEAVIYLAQAKSINFYIRAGKINFKTVNDYTQARAQELNEMGSRVNAERVDPSAIAARVKASIDKLFTTFQVKTPLPFSKDTNGTFRCS